ncbi:glycosyltransferase [Enemella dayhoffiae]|nr:glycosyltransferase [Enemella dayhoffiae]
MTLERRLRVASVPAAHPYVRAITAGSVTVLPDPIPPGRPAGQWWPPLVLTPDWLRAHRPEVVHVHFGFESLTVAELRAVLAVIEELDLGLLVTVHDLTNPQLSEQTRHVQQLALLVAAADRVITLTPGAAAEIARRFGRAAEVLPHPTLLTEPVTRVGAGSRSPVGVHLKSLRAGIDRGAVADTIAATAELGVDCVLSVHPGAGAPLREHAARPHVAWWEHEPLAEAELHAWLAGLGVLVLPYASGTHSGLLELCGDLGVPVAVPAIGHHADQQPDPSLLGTWPPGDRAGLTRALRRLLAGRATVRPNDRVARLAQRDRVAARHAELWAEVARIPATA